MAELEKARERTDRVRDPRAARHVSAQRRPIFTASFSALGRVAYEGAQVSANVLDL